MTRLLDLLGEAVTDCLLGAIGLHLAEEAWESYVKRLGATGWLCMHCGEVTFNASWECDACEASRGTSWTSNRFDLSDVSTPTLVWPPDPVDLGNEAHDYMTRRAVN